MYRILFFGRDDELKKKFGVSSSDNEFFVSSIEDVSEIIENLSSFNVVFTVAKIPLFSVDEVLDRLNIKIKNIKVNE